MNTAKIVPFLAALALVGCYTTSEFSYPEKATECYNSNGSTCVATNKTVSILPFEDLRGRESSVWLQALCILPLVPYGRLIYERPDEVKNFGAFSTIDEFVCEPSHDLPKAVAFSMNKSKLFSRATYTNGDRVSQADFVLTGRIKRMKFVGKTYTYCVSSIISGALLWSFGAPVGSSENEMCVELELRNKKGNVVWMYDAEGKREWTYYIKKGSLYQGDEECKAFAGVFQDCMNEALANLASRMNKNPDLFK